jgi:ParB family chromosome partitioning protein
MKRSASSLLTSVDELFTTQQERDEAQLEKVQRIPLAELRPFKDHPFKVQNNEEMERITESIRKVGVLSPGLARPMEDGGYELVSGHRRLAACQALGLEDMPVVIREMTDDEAVIAMVDANLQREHILPSEKAFAYKMKRDALEHQGSTSPQVGEKLLTVEVVGKPSGDSKNQVLRYIRLTSLIPELLAKVDEGRIAFNPAVELSYLSEEQQRQLLTAMETNQCTPSHAQAIQLKKAAQAGTLDAAAIEALMRQEKPNQQEQIKLKREDFRSFFPPRYTNEEIRRDIFKGLELLKRQRERSRDAR